MPDEQPSSVTTLTPITLNRRDAATAVALAILVLFTGWLRMAPGVCGSFHDDAIYVSTAEALASGQGYRLIDVPGAPLQTKYPVLYPALLSAVWYLWPIFPENLIAMQVLTLAFAAATSALVYLYLVRFGYFSRSIAAAAGVVCATVPYFLYFAVQTMAEMPFALATVAALWGVELLDLRRQTSKRGQFGWGMLLAVPFLCRSIGATIVVTSLWVLWRNGRPLRWVTAGAACAAAPWVLWSLLGRGIWDSNPVDGYYTDYLGCWSSTGLAMVARVFSRNAVMIAHGSTELPLEGVSALVGPWLGRGYTFIVLAVLGLAPWLAMMPDLRKNRPLPWMLLGTLGAMLVWSWPPYRFVVPILPFVCAYLLQALATALGALQPATQRPFARVVAAAGLVVIVLANAVLLGRHAQQVHETGYPLARLTDSRVDWSSYERTFAWVSDHSRPQDVMAAGLDSMVALYTGRPAFRPFVYNPGRLFYGDAAADAELLEPEQLATILQRYQPRYLVRSPMPGFMEEHPLEKLLSEVRDRYPDWLEVVYQDANPRFTVYRLDSRHAPGKVSPAEVRSPTTATPQVLTGQTGDEGPSESSGAQP